MASVDFLISQARYKAVAIAQDVDEADRWLKVATERIDGRMASTERSVGGEFLGGTCGAWMSLVASHVHWTCLGQT